LASAAAAFLWEKQGFDDHMQQMYLLSTCDMREKGELARKTIRLLSNEHDNQDMQADLQATVCLIITASPAHRSMCRSDRAIYLPEHVKFDQLQLLQHSETSMVQATTKKGKHYTLKVPWVPLLQQ
jgi:hypothetical protein